MSEHAATHPAAPSVFWENRYQETGTVWSGRVNATTADVVRGLQPGRAVDLGCGEGGDAIWLAQQGWNVTGVDISPTAITRARTAAATAGPLPGTVRFDAVDLESWSDGEDDGDGYDLVSASFFHSPVALTRTSILRAAASRTVTDGHLLIVTHAAAPPWAPPETHRKHTFLTPDEEIAELGLDRDLWEVRISETRSRTTTGPDGEAATLDDGVVLLRRRRPFSPRHPS